MRFSCKSCGYPSDVESGVPLNDAGCERCQSPLSLTDDERLVGDYQLLEKIGSGGFGSVWKAHHIDRSDSVALKLIPKDSFSDDERIHLLRQVRSSKHLQHPRVVAAHDFGEDGEHWFLVSDYVDGLPLGPWAKQNHPDATSVAMTCASMGDTIHYVHQQGFVHRDLKPGNIILDQKDQPHIIDFGLCKNERDPDMMAIERYRATRLKMRQGSGGAVGTSVLGTPAYTPPEQASGDAFHATARSDIYSLGVIFYELLCGRRPFIGSGNALIRQILTARASRPSRHRPNIPANLDAVCMKAISKTPQDRYQSAAEFAEDLRAAVAGEAVHAASLPRWQFWW